MTDRDALTPFQVGDIVLTPDDETATVVYLAPEGRIAVESPWSAQWVRYAPDELRLLVEAS